ncbi:hypothetical protein AKJ61_01335 [candidate division MSBL1 archaeon SCGC-AAA259B11]|uniref:Uncharacterized protein n=1 Tax=candidate division MSBL1 archaeon SCGC-AAA259B11 TaxID=1698260 RepID=A0A133U7J0_9EURY|nr:hypothetical protein AKJ61_01335 [candidate division MSBL1 archaeon SCGC-AAA259B11]
MLVLGHSSFGLEVLLWEVKDLSDFFDKIRAGSKIAIQYTRKVKTSDGHEAKLYDHAIEEWR